MKLITQLPVVDGHCAFLIARLNSNLSWEGEKASPSTVCRLMDLVIH